MKLIRILLEWKLRVLARWILRKYHPRVVGVTGSVGKTSAVAAIHTVLSAKFRARKNIKNYNNELGVPLSIIGAESGRKNPLSWLLVFLRTAGLLIVRSRQYPEVLVLEMGADKPGDIRYLVNLVPCTVGVLTAIGPAHLELFGTMERVIREKRLVVSHLPPDGTAVLNADDPAVLGCREKVSAHIVTFGYVDTADVRATEVDVSAGPSGEPWADAAIRGLSFKLLYGGSTVPVFLPSVIGEHQVYSALVAAAVGISFGMNLADVSAALGRYQSPPGRMRLLPGIQRTSIIDDTYNSSPLAATAALKVLRKVSVPGLKYAVLGDMLELGAYTDAGHREVGAAAVGAAQVLVTVGERSRITAEAARAGGMADQQVFCFATPAEASRFLLSRIQQGDIILVKGSQGARMEPIVRDLMAEPERAGELLVRQGPEWRQ
ncbi:MAG: UDP-N-acetylmuramoyl-tripeptide--D-alanyl-D-alanine ligase [Patescibacteria group bacterium]